MENNKTKKDNKYLCKNCGKLLNEVRALQYLAEDAEPIAEYCDNKECVDYRILKAII